LWRHHFLVATHSFVPDPLVWNSYSTRIDPPTPNTTPVNEEDETTLSDSSYFSSLPFRYRCRDYNYLLSNHLVTRRQRNLWNRDSLDIDHRSYYLLRTTTHYYYCCFYYCYYYLFRVVHLSLHVVCRACVCLGSYYLFVSSSRSIILGWQSRSHRVPPILPPTLRCG